MDAAVTAISVVGQLLPSAIPLLLILIVGAGALIYHSKNEDEEEYAPVKRIKTYSKIGLTWFILISIALLLVQVALWFLPTCGGYCSANNQGIGIEYLFLLLLTIGVTTFFVGLLKFAMALFEQDKSEKKETSDATESVKRIPFEVLEKKWMTVITKKEELLKKIDELIQDHQALISLKELSGLLSTTYFS